MHNSDSNSLLQSILADNKSVGWRNYTKFLKSLLELFSIFKVLLKKAVHVENISEKRENCTTEKVGKQANCNSSGALEPATYTHGLDKASHFFQDGHVQNVRFYPMASQPNHVCIGTNVLPSMNKGNMYSTITAYCTCWKGILHLTSWAVWWLHQPYTAWKSTFTWVLMKMMQ